MDNARRQRITRRAVSIAGLAALIAVWDLSTRFGLIGRTVLAGPSEVASVLLHSLVGVTPRGEDVFLHARATIERALVGWLIAALVGTALGVLAGVRRLAAAGAEPLLELARSIPPVMVFPMLLIAFDFGTEAYVSTIVFGCAPMMTLAVAHGVRSISREKLELLQVHSVPTSTRVIATMMEVLPSFVLGARITLALALVIAVVTEMVFAPRSGVALGTLAKEAEISFRTPVFTAAIVVIAVFGTTANALLRAAQTRLGGETGEVQ